MEKLPQTALFSTIDVQIEDVKQERRGKMCQFLIMNTLTAITSLPEITRNNRMIPSWLMWTTYVKDFC